MNDPKKSPFPTPPKSIGLSRRLVVTLAVAFLSVMILFLVFFCTLLTKANSLYAIVFRGACGSVGLKCRD